MPRHSLIRQRITVLAMTILTLSVVLQAGGDEVAKEGTFEGNWSTEGSARSVEVDSKEMKLFRVEGPVKVKSRGGLAKTFEALCVGVSDDLTGGVGRCVWTDAEGDKIFFELSGTIFLEGGSVREAHGAVIGGTGRYDGVEGEFKIDWIFIESALDDNKFKSYVTKLEGSWKRP